MTADLPGGATMDFVWIEPGTFTMGSPSPEPDRASYEGPQHEVTISHGFWLGKYEITQEQWEAVTGEKPWAGRTLVRVDPEHPATYFSWDDVQAFLGLLNAGDGQTVYRLPTEAEWEYACRAGSRMRWCFGDDEGMLGDYCWYRHNTVDVGLEYPQSGGTKLANAWGLFDMHGNVLEWVQDWFGPYPSAAQVDPQGPYPGAHPVVRGGSFDDEAHSTRSADRGPLLSWEFSPTPRDDFSDFRFPVIGARLLITECIGSASDTPSVMTPGRGCSSPLI